MNEAKPKSNFLGLTILFAIISIVGIVLSYIYIIFQVNIHDIWVNMIAVFVLGLVLAVIVWLVKRFMKITNSTMSFVVVVIGIAIAMYVMWGLWFALMHVMLYTARDRVDVTLFSHIGNITSGARDIIFTPSRFIDELRYFNQRGTWAVNQNQWYGLPLGFVWFMELFILVVPALMVAYASTGLYLTELNAWVKERLMNYGFTAFEASELDLIASGDIDVILEKPLEAHGGPMHAIAVCYHKGEPTDFVAVYKADWDKDGSLSKGRHIMTVKLGLEKIDALDAGLQAIHFPDIVDEDIPEDFEQDELMDEVIAPTDSSVNSNDANANAIMANELIQNEIAADLAADEFKAEAVSNEPPEVVPTEATPTEPPEIVPNATPTPNIPELTVAEITSPDFADISDTPDISSASNDTGSSDSE